MLSNKVIISKQYVENTLGVKSVEEDTNLNRKIPPDKDEDCVTRVMEDPSAEDDMKRRQDDNPLILLMRMRMKIL